MIAAAIVTLLGLGALLYVVAPLRGPRIADSGRDDGVVDEAVARKRSALDALMDLEDERAAGKLSSEDFAALKNEYETEAVRALDALESLGRSDDALEAEIASMRERMTCPECGALRPQGKPCPRCGT